MKIKKLLSLLLVISIPVITLGQSPGGVATNLSVWYKADNGVTTNATKLVTQWNSSSATNVALTPSGAAILPYNDQTSYTSTWNFNPTVTFNGTNNYLRNNTTAYLTSAGSVHYIVVAKGTNRNNNAQSLFAFAGNDDGFFYSGDNGNTALPAITNNYNSAAAAITSPNDFGIYSAILPRTAVQGTQRGFYNGLKKNYTAPYPITAPTYSLPTTGAYMGADGTTGDNFFGDIAEVIIYHSPIGNDIPDTDLEKIHSYLAVKYGITLISTQNYLSSSNQVVWNATSNAGYTSNIFGVARDNLAVLHQKQSKSANLNQKLVIGNGNSLFGTNAANTNSLTDGQFLLVGDNGLEQKLKTPLSYTAGSNGDVNYRFESIWKVQNSNGVGAVTVAWPKGVSNLYLVQSTDDAFDGTDTFTPMTTEVTVNGVVYNTANVTLGNGQFFTFAGFEYAPGGVTGTDFWVKSDDAGTIATAWKDQAQGDNIPNVGGVTLSPADRAHNFHPYTTGYTNSKYFHNNTSVLNPLGNIEYPNISTSIFSAIRPTAIAGGRIIGIDNDAANAAEPGVSITAAGRPRQYEYFNTTTTSDFSTTFNIGQSNIFSALANNTVANGGTSAISGGEKRLGLNGTYESFSGFGAGNKFQLYGTNLRLGYATWDVSGDFPGDIMEIVWYNRTLTANEQSRVNSYLAIKNGVTATEDYLTSGNNTVWSIATNTGYNNNIFGLARDNNSALHQKQAASTANGQKLVIGNGTSLFDSNAANTNTLADGQFLMIGDNGLKQGLAIPLAYTAGSNGVTNFRFESIWKVQNTNTVGTVTVAWPKGVKNLYLVQSLDAAFDGTDTFAPMATEVTVNGVVYNTANVTLGNGQFFTFAGFGNAPGGVTNGLSYWYRADVDATNTGAATDVTAWKDVWNGTTVSQRATNALPKYAQGAANYFNFNPGINFTAINQTLANIAVQSVTNTSNDIFTVTKEGMTAPSSYVPHFLSIGMDNTTTGASNWDYTGISPISDMIERRVVGGGTQFVNTGVNYATTIPSIMYNTFSNTTLSRGLNGAANGTTQNYSAVGLALGGHIFGSIQWAGNGADNVGGLIGNIGETIIYGGGNITAAERRKVDSYLAIKYGITLGRVGTDHYLNANAAIVWNGGTNTTYNNNIFGVAREDIGLFEQKVSTSVNPGTILTVATINDFVSPNNTASRTSFANDKTYFLLGDNNVATTALSSITINGFTGASRIPKIWLSQRTNTSGTMYFGADLSSYGAGFGSGDHVKMIIADDAAFTTNVAYIDGNYDATAGKWVHSYNFDSGNANRYITYATVNEVACTTGCNGNAYLNAVDPNTIEYDNMVASGTSSPMTIAKQKDGSFWIWGYSASPNQSSGNLNLSLNLTVPTKIDPATVLPTSGSVGSGFQYTGTLLKATIANKPIILTTDGLYAWGGGNMFTSVWANTAITYKTPIGTTNTSPAAFGKVTVNSKSDGLPPGVSPGNVKMLFGSGGSLAITTCSGAAWVFDAVNGYQGGWGDGATTTTNDANSKWHRVMTSATQTLDNVVAVRGTEHTKFALTSDGKLYTWGTNIYRGDGTNTSLIVPYATEVVVPAGVTPKMIGMTYYSGSVSYYLLATNGRLYAMGNNGSYQLGDGTNTERKAWVEITATSGSNTLGGNIAWISPSEHSDVRATINVLTTDGKQWGWGANNNQQLGAPAATVTTPKYMPGNGTGANELGLNDKVIAVETGQDWAINFKASSTSFGFIGAGPYGVMGDGSNTSTASTNKYTYISPLDICAVAATSVCYKPGVLGTGLDTKAGITSLGRAGATNTDNWPMTRKGGWIALEAKTKAFVPNRVAFSGGNPVGITSANFVEGMMVYDTTNKCMKMYTLKDGDTSMAWHCISTQACPD